jgi:hypothetical protein
MSELAQRDSKPCRIVQGLAEQLAPTTSWLRQRASTHAASVIWRDRLGTLANTVLAATFSLSCLGCSNTIRRPAQDGSTNDGSLSLETPIPTNLEECTSEPVRCPRSSSSCDGSLTVGEMFTTCGSDVRVAHCDRSTGRCACTTIGQQSCSCRVRNTNNTAFQCQPSGDTFTLPANCCWEDR